MRLLRTCVVGLAALSLWTSGCGGSEVGGVVTCECPDVSCEADTFEADTAAPDTDLDLDTADTSEADTVDALEDITEPPSCPWLPADDGLRGGFVSLVQFDPRVPGIAFATSGPVLYRSADAGRTWSVWTETEASFTRLAFPTSDPKAILAAGPGGVWESLDSGLTFELKSLGGFGVFELVVHPALDQRAFAGTDGAGILRSDDLGGGWRPHNVGFPRARVRSAAGHPTDPEVALFGVNLQTDAMGSANDGQLLRTDDGGRHWEVALDGVGWINDIAYCDADPNVAWAAVRAGVARSDDGGVTWAVVDGFGQLDALEVAVHPTDCDVAWAAVYREGVYRTEDGGATAVGPFTDGFEIQLTTFNPQDFVVDPADGQRLFASTHGGLYLSEDAGETWVITDVGDSIAVADVAASAAAPGRLWLTTWGSGTWTKPALDAPWERVPVTALPRDFAFSVHPDPADAGRVFVGASPELWVTEDGGATFSALDLRQNVMSLAFLEGPDEVLIGTQVRGFYLADDNASVWTESNGDLVPWETNGGTFIDIRAIAADPEDSDLILAGTKGNGILRTTDRGATWTRVGGDELADQIVRVIVRSALPSERWYALVEARGVYVSYDDGASWERTGTSLDTVAIKDLVVDPGTGFLYLATSDTGIYRSVDGAAWQPFDRYCQPVLGYSYLTLLEAEGARWLVAIGARNTVIRHALD